MGMVLLLAWGAALWCGTASPARTRVFRWVMACALAFSMLTQLWLLWLDGLLTLETGLPLHLCGLFGVFSIPMLLWRAPAALYELSAFLAGPAAAVTLLFPAVMPCSHPQLMRFAFLQLHALVALVPLYFFRTGKPLPRNPRRALVLGNGYLVAVSAFNRIAHTNYLFLRAVPAATPLAVLRSPGGAYYICALEMLCMLVFVWLDRLYGRVNAYCRK